VIATHSFGIEPGRQAKACHAAVGCVARRTACHISVIPVLADSAERLYVVENVAQRIAVIDLDVSTGLGTLRETLAVEEAQTPTTSALFGSAIYTVDARLGTPFVGPYRVFRIER
jgi:hypothetical protein